MRVWWGSLTILVPGINLKMDALKDSARALGVELDDAQARAFHVYAGELLAWNAKFNLTAITDRAEIDRKHFLDSLSALSVIRSLHHASPSSALSSNLRVLDVGAGAGFPAVPLKLACPDWRVHVARLHLCHSCTLGASSVTPTSCKNERRRLARRVPGAR